MSLLLSFIVSSFTSFVEQQPRFFDSFCIAVGEKSLRKYANSQFIRQTCKESYAYGPKSWQTWRPFWCPHYKVKVNVGDEINVIVYTLQLPEWDSRTTILAFYISFKIQNASRVRAKDSGRSSILNLQIFNKWMHDGFLKPRTWLSLLGSRGNNDGFPGQFDEAKRRRMMLQYSQLGCVCCRWTLHASCSSNVMTHS